MSIWKICRVQYDETKTWSTHILERYALPDSERPDLRARVEISELTGRLVGGSFVDAEIGLDDATRGSAGGNRRDVALGDHGIQRATIEITAQGWRLAVVQTHFLAAEILMDERTIGASMFQMGGCGGLRITSLDVAGVLSAYFGKDLALPPLATRADATKSDSQQAGCGYPKCPSDQDRAAREAGSSTIRPGVSP